ncbi:hypothetical protein [Sphingomonas sp. 8AM]|uniref:hypothetical protein n=1 Tax=Sphingomonas sp. 8AM TaxID=2653170 RepID=UPI001358B2A9|nr:hypothetical protein [Sphingomonas sp. 8AM]
MFEQRAAGAPGGQARQTRFTSVQEVGTAAATRAKVNSIVASSIEGQQDWIACRL